MGRGAWRATVHRIMKESDTTATEQQHIYLLPTRFSSWRSWDSEATTVVSPTVLQRWCRWPPVLRLYAWPRWGGGQPMPPPTCLLRSARWLAGRKDEAGGQKLELTCTGPFQKPAENPQLVALIPSKEEDCQIKHRKPVKFGF